ncbi:MAG: Coenzyme F420 hydrogenase/dehydrogenase, beta subunit C-terminal domain [Caldilineaceae bacterium]|nr:Coenzyme F420 hydrogenase/dehydrogenase, beta subunit C-terminal domain [Caldilineaceae bacterium]
MKASRLEESVIAGDYCIGCGACAAVAPQRFAINFDEYGMLKATRADTPLANIDAELPAVCPFGEESWNEDQIGAHFFDRHACTYDQQAGYFLHSYAGHVAEGSYRQAGSSGGMTSWLLAELLAQKLVDRIVHVQASVPSESGQPLFQYQIAETLDRVRAGAKSRYYPVEMSQVLQQIKQTPGRYAVVGVPCFIKALRLLMVAEPVYQERIAFTIGLVCGHLKSRHFASLFAWQAGIAPAKLTAIDFRHKLAEQPANRYGVRMAGVVNGQPTTVTRPTAALFGSNWGYGFFKYKACDYCDDVLAETADVTCGDAWLPEYVNDSAGTNILVIRNPALQALVQQGIDAGRLQLTAIPIEKVIQSQAAGFRHRRAGLAYRLYQQQRKRRWHPPKRVAAQQDQLSWRRRLTYTVGESLRERSHRAFQRALQQQKYAVFEQRMQWWTKAYDLLISHHLLLVMARKLHRLWPFPARKKS